MTVRIYRDAVAGGGGSTQPTIAELNDPNYIAPVNQIIPPAENLIIKEAEQAAKKPGEEGYVAPELKPGDEGYVVPVLKPGDVGYVEPPAKTPEEIAAEEAAAAAALVALTPEQETANFFASVTAKTGREIKVEYPVGIDPLTPEGIAIRDEVLFETAQTEFEDYMKKTNPRGFAYMMHLAQGGTDEEFLGKGAGFALPEKTVIESDVANQTNLLKLSLRTKGVEEVYIDSIVAAAIKDNTLKDKALKAYDGIVVQQAKELQLIETREAQIRTEEARLNTSFAANLTKTISAMSFAVQETDKAGFNKFISENVQIVNGKMYMVRPFDMENLQPQVEAAFFEYKKGDLNKIIRKQAETVTSQRLRSQTDRTKQTPPASLEPNKTSTKSLPLNQIL